MTAEAPSPGERVGSSWRFVAATFLSTRLALWLVALYALLVFEPNPFPLAPGATHGGAIIWDVWERWDSGSFITIARHWYHGATDLAAFFPLYPGLLSVVGHLLGGQYVIAGVVVSLLASAAAFQLLHSLARTWYGEATARRAVVYLALAPMSVFLQTVYSESLYLMLALGAFVLAERGRFALAGGVAGLALLSRPSGIALFPAIALLAWISTHSIRRTLLTQVGGLFFVAYPIVLWQRTGSPWRFLHAESSWQRHGTLLGPLNGFWKGLTAAWDGIRQLTGQVAHPDAATNPSRIAVLNLECFGFLLVFLVLSVLTWRRLGAAYGVFAFLSLALPLSVPARFYPLNSLPRFGLVIFPFYVVLAQLGERRLVDRCIIGLGALLLGATTVQWALGEWVA